MKKAILHFVVIATSSLFCVDIGQMGLFANKYGEVVQYDLADSLRTIPYDNWKYIPNEQSGCTDAIFLKSIDTTVLHDNLVIFFYGTGYNLYYSAQVGKLFWNMGLSFLSSDYYGFGRTVNTIKPDEDLCYRGATEIIQYAIDSLGFDSHKIILCGFSLGTGIAVEMATRYSVAAVILFAPFMNTDIVVKTVSGGYDIPRDWFLQATFNNGEKIGNISAPLCMFAGENDCLIVPQNMKELFKRAREPKTQYVLPGEDHPDFPTDSYEKWKDRVLIFLKNNT